MKIAITLLTIIILMMPRLVYSDEDKVCFYAKDEFEGENICLAPNEEIDLYYSGETLPVHNDSIKSISIPSGMKATVYGNDNFNAPYFELTESITDESLKALGMSSTITGIKASEDTGLSCDQQCVIVSNHRIKLVDTFGEYWNDTRLKNKQVLFVFNTDGLGEDDNYDLTLLNSANITINKRRISFSDQGMRNKFYFERYKRSKNLSFIIQVKEDTLQIQYIQTSKNNLIEVSPIISFDWDNTIYTSPNIVITNYNQDNPLILAKNILTADTDDKDWEKRDLTQTSKIMCTFTPFLNIYNYLIQGKCQQLDNIVFSADKYFSSNTKGKTLHIAGNSQPLKQKPLKEMELRTEETTDNYMTLTYIHNNINSASLSLPAVAKACMVSLHYLLNSRPTRQIRPQCIDWTLEVMTDFTLLFGNSLETWNSAFFGRIIDSIIRTGGTGVAVENQAVENRLIHAITEKIIDRTTHNTFGDIKTALDYARLSYVSYSAHFSSDESPSQVELLPLGIYELLLETLIYRPTPPIIISHGESVEQTELEFEIEILPTPTPEEEEKLSDVEVSNAQAMRKKLRETVALWEQQYEQGYPAQGASADVDTEETNEAKNRLLRAGNVVTGIINRRLILHRPGEIYVIVKFQGRVIAVVLADRFNSRDEVELVASATLPDYVLFPDREGTVRGAGTAAVRELGRYLQQQGARTLFAEVISQPSARVKQKVGFNFKSEF
ncbi:GNAT family N-acetyltransferase [Yersinia sp. LJYL362]|uniref:GNAT family N-acetyltransferase n=1 Tax=Yersinia sp. LJYL362 TaxID=3402108 RepID=UPI003AB7F19D